MLVYVTRNESNRSHDFRIIGPAMTRRNLQAGIRSTLVLCLGNQFRYLPTLQEKKPGNGLDFEVIRLYFII